ncbi:MAG: AraC family transcriptional regulator [Treponema sp.]|jgi:AraC-like DNA-binding protein|nr:AraC family transcriptional regulator [Treponema sp.]
MNKTAFDDFVPEITTHTFRKCAPGWRISPYSVSGYHLTYVVKGSARYTINGAPHDVEHGDLISLSGGDLVEAVTSPHNTMHHYDISFSRKHPREGKIFPLFPAVSRIGIRNDIIGIFRELTISWNEQSAGYLMKSHALFMLILHRLSEIILYDVDTTQGDYRINKITRYIARHYAEKLTVKNLAAQVNLNTDYFGQLFKQQTGMMVNRYISQVRVQNAERLLQTGACKVHEAAEQCGFSDVFHFYKSFKTLRGFPPSRCLPKR